MAIYFFDKNQTLIKIVPESATFEAIQTQELDDDSLLKDTLSVTVKGDEKLINAEYMAVKSYKGNAQTFDMYRIVTDTTPDKSMSFTGMSLAPYELNGHIIQDLRPANHSLSYTLNRILDGTDWRVGYIDDSLQNVTTNFYYVSAKEALKELQSLVGCEFVFKVEISGQKITDKWIEVYKEMGNRTKKRFNYGTNALTVVRETNKADIYTALIGRGKGEEVSSGEDNESGQAGYGRKITFEDIEWKKSSGKPLDKPKGQYYLELPQATQAYGIKNIDGTMKARVGIVDFDDEEDKNRLINLTYQQLLVSSRPKVLFKTTVANVGATGIGDTVTIHRHDLNIHYQTRVRKIVRNKLNDNKTQIELGDAVVTASTKQTKQNNATIKNLNNEIDKIKANVTTSQNSADGKNTIFYGSAEPERQRTGDTWYRPHPSIAGETQMLTWNGTAWELVIDTSDLTSVSRAVEDAAKKADEAVQAAKDADTKANDAIVKAGTNASLLTTHQNTINTINTVTLPDIVSTAGTALADAKDAMDEAKKADGKIADYVTKNGLVNGTTVDTKINDATGEISKKITTVESKIPTEIGGRNYLPLSKGALKSYNAYNTNWEISDKTIESVINRENNNLNLTLSYDSLSEPIATGEIITFSGFLKVNNEIPEEHPFINNNLSNASSSQTELEYNQDTGYFKATYPKKGSWLINTNTTLVNGDKISIYKPKLGKGTITIDWTPAPEDMLGKADFTIFKNDYDETAKSVERRLTAIDSSEEGSVVTRLNKTEKTASGNTTTISDIKTKPGEHITGYQTIKERSDLYERVIGSTGDEINQNVSRIIQTSDIIQTEVAKMDLATNEVLSSKITQLADNINLRVVSKEDLLSQINVQAGGVLITSGTNKLNVTPTTTYIENGTIKSAMIESLSADKIKTGTLDAGTVDVINLDAKNITSNKTSFVQSAWNAVNAFTQIDANGIQMLGSGTWRRTFLSPTGFRMFNGQGAGNKAGAIGYFKSSTDLGGGINNPLKEDFMWQNQERHTVGIGVNSNHLLSLGFQNPGANSEDGYNPALTIDPQKNGQVAVNTNARFNSSLQVDGDLTLPGGDYFTIHNGLYLYTSYWTVMAKTGVRFFVGDQKKLHIGGNVELGTTLDMAGNVITGQSDYRLKKNIETLNTNDLDKLTGVRMVSYEWIDPERLQGTHVGFIAQELKEVYPELITENDDGILSINNSELAMAHIHATQELNAKVDAHISSADDEVAKLKAQVASLQDELAQLKGD